MMTARTPFRIAVSLMTGLLLASTAPHAAEPGRANERERMVANVAQLASVGAGGRPRRLDPDVLLAMRRVPRHLFVPESQRSRAYTDSALFIGHDATISQPFIVGLMTDLLDAERDDVVLEVGTGSGYQAAILSGLVRRVYSIEIVPELAQRAAAQLKSLGYGNVTVRAGDGYAGWPEHAPFDRIIVTAGATKIPPALVRQLKPGGRMVIPVGRSSANQQLMLVTKDAAGRLRTQRITHVNFVPLVEPAG